MQISNNKLAEYIENNKEGESDENPYLNVGIYMQFVDSNAKKVVKELIIGDIMFNDNGSTTTMYTKKRN